MMNCVVFSPEHSPEELRILFKQFILIALEKCRFDSTSQDSRSQNSHLRKVSAIRIKEAFNEFDSKESGQIEAIKAEKALNKLGINFPTDISIESRIGG